MNRIKTNLYLRNKTYYCRLFVPRELHRRLGKKEIWKSLNTGIYNEALSKLHSLLATFNEGLSARCLNQVNHSLEALNRTPEEGYDYGNNITLGELIQAYNSSPEIARKGPSVRERVKPFQRLILGFFGKDTRVSELNRDRAKEFYKVLEQIPRNISYIYPDNINRELIYKAIKNNKGPIMTNGTAKFYWHHLKVILDWAINEDKYPTTHNYTNGLVFDSSSTTIRLPFTIEDLNLLFSNNGILKYKETKKDWFYWMCLLSLFTGARGSEVAQLRTSDIRQENNIWYISINRENGKGTKNKGSIRKVPIHSKLIKLGFVMYCQSLGKNKSLFPNYIITKGKTPCRNYSNDFADLVRELGIYDNVKNHESGKRAVKTLHSFRHTLNDFTYKLDDKIIREIFGWTGKEMREYYGSNEKISILDKKEELEKVTFKGIKFLDELDK